MERRFKSRNYSITQLPDRQSGYMLISLMLLMALAAIVLLAVLPDMAQQIKRNQEEEMCHRGTQYMRAIQHYYKKFGRYPTRVEDLENTNNLRFLRSRYKDPLAHDQQGKDKDFKLLHMQDVNQATGQSLGQIPGLGQAGSALGQNSGLGQNLNSLGALAGAGGTQGALLGALQQAGTAGSPSGGSNNAGANDEDEPSPNGPGNPGTCAATGASPGSGPGGSGGSGFNTGSSTGTGLNGTVFGGGPILGVASTSKAKTIREFNKKNHYNEWMFIYDPTSDRGGLLVGPWQIPQATTLQGATPAGQLTPGAQQPQSLGTPFGQSQGSGAQSPQPQQSPQQ